MAECVPLAFFSMPGGLEWVVIGLVALLLFGKRLPGVAKSLGQALHEFRGGLAGEKSGETGEAAGTGSGNHPPPPANDAQT
ncbi:MAG: twin-arginine translocase TatA/TatE family subunit [Planctomycetota bacterium]|jgi:sec-independent protein translocase protein TatA|nr:twin-arginine translocase TatA/TatE family subunit [Planctomycetota bacterium]